MTFQELIQGTGELLGLEEFAPDEEGFCTLESEEGAINIINISEEYKLVLLQAVVGALPVENSEAAIHKALEANCGFKQTGGATLSINSETGEFELVRYLALELLEPASFLAFLERFAATLLEVRGILKETEPEDAEAGEEAPDNDASPSTDPFEMASHGFVRI